MELEVEFKDILGISGFFIALALAAIKFIEFRRSKFKIEVRVSSDENADYITIFNLSDKPFQVAVWELHKRKKGNQSIEDYVDIELFDPTRDYYFKVDGYSREVLSFYEYERLPKKKDADIYIMLRIAGRKEPIYQYLY